MKIVLLRHATRSAMSLGDSPLTLVGLAQAEELGSKASHAQNHLPKPTHLFVSPKQRARQTLEPLAEKSGLRVRIDPRVDERHQNESAQDFDLRLKEFLSEIEALAADPTNAIYICSHLDWLELAVTEIATDLSEFEIAASWQTAEYRVFDFKDGLWQFKIRGRTTGSQAGS